MYVYETFIVEFNSLAKEVLFLQIPGLIKRFDQILLLLVCLRDVDLWLKFETPAREIHFKGNNLEHSPK